MSANKKRIGAYICHCGGNISDYVDTAKVAEVIGKEKDVVVAKDFIFMCSDPGQKMIAEDVAANNLTHVVVASCSPRLHQMTFQKVVAEAGINPFTYKHVNIREQVSWVHSHEPGKATEKAIRLIRGGIANATRQKELSPIEKQMIQAGAVIGGGVSGMTAALDLANRKISVHLIEKAPVLGGRTLELDKLYPYEVDAKKFVEDLIKQVNSNEYVIQHLSTEVVGTEGTIGDFTLKLARSNEVLINEPVHELVTIEEKNDELKARELHVGTVTMATGHDYYEPLDGEFGYNKSEFVITLPSLIKKLNSYKDKSLKINGKVIKNIAMIHCVGSRQIEDVHELREGTTYNTGCSRTCCTATLQQANRLKSMFPNINVYDLYRDIRTYGDKEVYYRKASENNVIFIKVPDDELPTVEISKDGLTIQAKDILTYGLDLEIDVDLIVLAVAMIPRPKPAIIENLSVPTDANHFLLEAHVKLRPVESATDGIFLAGTAQGPKDVKESTMSATATSAKASVLLKKEIIELSPYIATINEDICDGNGECVTQCEYNAISMIPTDNGKNAIITPALCVGCGACVPVCPKKAVTLQGYDLDVLTAEVRAMIQEVKP
ncbi:MAG: CoB--CoM heterodisulfide reductase iron-sulfur subunit A family protein [Candidatus Heimdallarchaeota archaeon]|nr:CoB--CoM heterodisulfide reductase iron-sulfur subunit A family protein [Candidatus Heimdallarchaeota archaeon]